MNVYKTRKRWPRVLLITVAIATVGAAAWYGWNWYEQKQAAEEAARQARQAQQQDQAPAIPMEQRFVERYYEVDLPGVERINTPPEITGNHAADTHIKQLAEERGYRLQFTPTRSLKNFQGEQLQPEAVKAWKRLKQAASQDGVSLRLVSGYRSIDTQRIIFDSQLRSRAEEAQGGPYTAGQIAGGEADKVLDRVLQEFSAPGYSKHHSGYAVDVNDAVANQSLEEFGQTEAYDWLSQDDYTKARQFGFLPSYPDGVDKLGPEAELWEYVWVGSGNTEFKDQDG